MAKVRKDYLTPFRDGNVLENALGRSHRSSILALLATNPDREFTTTELQDELEAAKASIYSHTKALAEIGLIEKERSNPNRYRINTDHPAVEPLMEFFDRLE